MCSFAHLDNSSKKHESKGRHGFARYPEMMVKPYLFRESLFSTGGPFGRVAGLSDKPTKKS